MHKNPIKWIDPTGFSSEEIEYFCRAMSTKEYKKLQANQGLTTRNEGQSAGKVSQSEDYAWDLKGRNNNLTRLYSEVVEFELKPGTAKGLETYGAAHGSAIENYPHLPTEIDKKSGNVEFKYEALRTEDGKQAVLSYGLGYSEDETCKS